MSLTLKIEWKEEKKRENEEQTSENEELREKSEYGVRIEYFDSHIEQLHSQKHRLLEN